MCIHILWMYNIYFWQTTTAVAAARLLRATAYIKAAAAMSHSRPEDKISLLLLLFYIEHVVVIFRNDRGPRGSCQKSPKNHHLSAKTSHEFLDAIQKVENVSLASDDGGAAVTDDHLYTTLCTCSTLTHNNMLHRYLTMLYGRVYIIINSSSLRVNQW